MSIKPSRILLIGVGSLLLLAICLGSAHALKLAVPVALDGLLIGLLLASLLLAAMDAWRLYHTPAPRCQRSLAQTLSLGRSTEVTLSFSHNYKTSLQLECFDHLPDSFQAEQLPYSVTLQPGHISSSRYRLKPLLRGNFSIAGCAVRLPSPMRLWTAQHFLKESSTVRVYPDFTRVQSGQLQASEHWLSQLGVQQQQRRGSGLEFHQLREFRTDDSLKQIDWKATARKRTPIAREYQDERDQQIIFLLDCGRSMRSQDGPLSHLDHALNACLLLAYAALRQGDAVGLQTFAGHQRIIIAPRKGPAQMSVLLNTLYDIQATQNSADYSAIVQQLLVTQKRRALVIVISSLADEADSDLALAMQLLKKHHRTLLVSLREEVLDQLREQPVQNYQQALLYCGGIDYLQTRQHNQQKLLSQGIDLLDVRPSQLTAKLISQYLKMKKSGHY